MIQRDTQELVEIKSPVDNVQWYLSSLESVTYSNLPSAESGGRVVLVLNVGSARRGPRIHIVEFLNVSGLRVVDECFWQLDLDSIGSAEAERQEASTEPSSTTIGKPRNFLPPICSVTNSKWISRRELAGEEPNPKSILVHYIIFGGNDNIEILCSSKPTFS